MRVHFWQYIVNDTGEPLGNVNVRVYLSNSPTTEAQIFVHPTAGISTTSSVTSLTTDANGFVECWFGDLFETDGYPPSQKFKVSWSRVGLSDGYIDNIDIYPNAYSVVETDNISSDKDVENKMISNQQAYNWEAHRTATGVNVHGLEEADWNDTDTTYNKLVNNSLMNYFWSVITSAGSVSIAASAAAVREFSVTSWSGSAGNYYKDLDHFLNRDYPVVSVYKQSNERQIQPTEIESISSTRTRLWMKEEVTINVTIIG